MKNDFNSMKKAFSKITMSDAAKRHIINTCDDTEIKNASTSFTFKKIVVVGACAMLAVISVATVVATSGFSKIRTNTNNESHIPEVNIKDNEGYSEYEGYSFSCNGIAGDKDRVYFDITVQREDGKVLTETKSNEYVSRFDPVDAYIEFSDGYRKEIYFTMLNDSNDHVYHLEASTLFYDSDRHYLGQEAKIYMGGIKVSLANSNESSRVICKFKDPVPVTIAVTEKTRTVTFEAEEFSIFNGGIVIENGEITATTVYFYGECSLSGPLYDLQGVLEEAYVILNNGKEVPLGAKTSAGTLPDGKFTIGWLTKTVIYPEKVSAICIDGKIIEID